MNSSDIVEVKPNQNGYKWRLVLAYDGTKYAGMFLFHYLKKNKNMGHCVTLSCFVSLMFFVTILNVPFTACVGLSS